jgi:serine protease Do
MGMSNVSRCLVGLAIGLFASPLLHSETVKDREGAVRGDKVRMEGDARWVYEDVDRGFREGSETGKPVLVVLRCVPCLACAGIDAGVLEEAALGPVLDRFVCVRVINANALDLKKFQFDYDLSFSAMIFHPDGTVYGRYGSWQHQVAPENRETGGFRRALEAALELHQKYPGNRSELQGKQGGATPFRTPIEFPSLAGKYQSKLDWGGKVVASCVHCHMIGDANRAHARSRELAIPEEWIFPHPSPATLGAQLAGDGAARVESVEPESAAAKAGWSAGDELISLQGQPLISAADVHWVLHQSPSTGSLVSVVRRGDSTLTTTLELPAGWRGRSDISRRVGTWPMRAMALGGLKLVDLDDGARRDRGLSTDAMALRVEHAGEYGEHAAAKNAGFRRDDVLVAIGGRTDRLSESALIGWLLAERRPGEKVPTVILRAGERLELPLPQQ